MWPKRFSSLLPNRADGSLARFYQSTAASWRVGTKASSGMARVVLAAIPEAVLLAGACFRAGPKCLDEASDRWDYLDRARLKH